MKSSSKTDPKKLDDILNTGSLSNILKKARILEALNAALTRHLSATLCVHCQVMNFKGSILVIGVDNAAWLTRLRYEENNLIHALQGDAEIPNILGIEYKILYS